MEKSLISIYRIPLLISLVLVVAMLGIADAREPIQIAETILAGVLGVFILDSEYFLNAYFLDTTNEFSKTLVGYIKHSDIKNALRHIHFHKEESTQNSLNSALFQVVLAVMSIFVVYVTASMFAKALVVIVFAQSIYVLFEYYYKNKTDDWFWAFKNKPNKMGVQLYLFGLLAVLSFALYAF